MADTKRTLSTLQTLFADNTIGDISAQDVRDFLITVYGSWTTTSKTYANSPYTNTLNDTVLVFDGTSGAIVHNIYGDEGKVLIVQATGANYVTVTAGGVETIAGAATFVVPVGNYAIFCKVGSVWSVFSPLASNGVLKINTINAATGTLALQTNGASRISVADNGFVTVNASAKMNFNLEVTGALDVTGGIIGAVTGSVTGAVNAAASTLRFPTPAPADIPLNPAKGQMYYADDGGEYLAIWTGTVWKFLNLTDV